MSYSKEQISSIAAEYINNETQIKELFIKETEEMAFQWRAEIHELGAFTSTEQKKHEKIFSIIELGELNNVSPVEDRIQANERIAVWYMLASGKLQEHLDKLPELQNQEKIDTATELLYGFLEKNKLKSKEQSNKRDPNLPTIGLEAEYKIADIDLVTHMDAAMAKDLPMLAADSAKNSRAGIIATGLSKNTPFKNKKEIGGKVTNQELEFTKSFDAKTQLRELLYLLKEGVIDSKELAVHFNIAELKLDMQNVEPMLITATVMGLGYNMDLIPQEFINTEAIRKVIENQIHVIDEYVKKRAETDAKYYPLHRPKVFSEKTNSLNIEETDQIIGVEFRGTCRFDNFADMVKAAETYYLLSAAAIAKQKIKADPNGIHSKETQSLAETWDTFERDVVELFNSKNILLNEKKSIREATQVFNQITTGTSSSSHISGESFRSDYTEALTKIDYLSQKDPEFNKALSIITGKCRTKVREITAKNSKE